MRLHDQGASIAVNCTSGSYGEYLGVLNWKMYNLHFMQEKSHPPKRFVKITDLTPPPCGGFLDVLLIVVIKSRINYITELCTHVKDADILVLYMYLIQGNPFMSC